MVTSPKFILKYTNFSKFAIGVETKSLVGIKFKKHHFYGKNSHKEYKKRSG